MSLKGKVAVVTGGNGGIGLGFATGLAQAGAEIAIWARNLEKSEVAVAKLKTLGINAKAFNVDVADKNQINQLIAENLRSRGVTATTGATPSANNVDAIVTYIDRWMWDITMYLLQLTVTVSDPKTNAQLATATSLHGSLTRLSPAEMVNETMSNIYNGKVEEEK